MKKDNAILIGVGVAIAGFFGYRYWKKNQDEKALEEEKEKQKQAETPPPPSGGVTSQPVGFTDYQKKVMQLQTKIGVTPTGNALTLTNNAVKSWFPTLYAKLGNVTPNNVDQYIAAKKEDKTTANNLQALWNAMKAKTYAKFIKDAQVAAYYYDAAKQSYIPTGGYFTVKQGETVYYSGAVLTGAGIARVLPTYTSSGNPAGNKLVMIKPEMIYVP